MVLAVLMISPFMPDICPTWKITVDSRLNIREPLAKFKGDFVRNGLKEEWSKVRGDEQEPHTRLSL